MGGMRELLREHLRRSLGAAGAVDRLAAAWPVVCGATMAAHGVIAAYVEGVVTVQVWEADWLRQMQTMQGQIAGELGRVAGVKVVAIHFERTKERPAEAGPGVDRAGEIQPRAKT